MKILLLGRGLLGKALFDAFSGKHEVIALSHEDCDITDTKKIQNKILDIKPEIVVNAAGYTAVDKAESEKDLAFNVNAQAVANLAQFLAKKGITFLHFSTDYVFDGKKRQGYAESDSPAPLCVYGKSKFEGEQGVILNMRKYFLIRSSWLFGEGGKNFVDTVIDSSKKGEPLKVVNDQTGSPTYSRDLAQAVLPLLESKNYGIYHIVNSGSCTWYEFAKETFHQIGVPQEIIPISSKELNRPAKRPKYSILKNTKLAALRSWKQALASYLKDKTLLL